MKNINAKFLSAEYKQSSKIVVKLRIEGNYLSHFAQLRSTDQKDRTHVYGLGDKDNPELADAVVGTIVSVKYHQKEDWSELTVIDRRFDSLPPKRSFWTKFVNSFKSLPDPGKKKQR